MRQRLVRRAFWMLLLVLAVAGSTVAATAQTSSEPKLGKAVKLFNGKNLAGFYTFVEKRGVNQDPKGVFTVANGMVRVSGEEYGYFVTEKEYENFYLLVEFKWGEKTFAPRVENARDSGILFHTVGEEKIWPKSIEFQIIEGGTGDIILVGGTSLTVKGERGTGKRFDRFGKGPWKDEVDYRDPVKEVEKPRGEWNRLEMWTDGANVRMLVNGELVNEGTDASLQKGKILFQSEGAELYFRRIDLRPILRK
jgi:hypothetical protein